MAHQQLTLDAQRMAVPCRHPRPACPARHWMGGEQSHEAGPGNPSIEDGHHTQATAQRLHSSHPSRVEILLTRLSEALAAAWGREVDEQQR